MPRKPRVEVAGGIHHVYARGNDRRRIFLDDEDRACYLDTLAYVTEVQGWYLLAYCLMDNHVHLVVETPEPNLAVGMQRLHGLYAQDFNERRGRCGHLFQGRYGARLITSDEQLWATIAYVTWNPPDAGLCGEPHEWSWSSHAAVLGWREPQRWLATDRLLEHFAGAGGHPRARYVELTGSPPSEDELEDVLDRGARVRAG